MKIIFASLLLSIIALSSTLSAGRVITELGGKLAVICENPETHQNQLDIYEGMLNLGSLGPTNLARIHHAVFNPDKQTLVVSGRGADDKGVIEAFSEDKVEILLKDEPDFSGTDNIYVTTSGHVFTHSHPCGCCVGQNAFVIYGAKSTKIHFPFKVGYVGFNSSTDELSFFNVNQCSLTLKPQAMKCTASVTVRMHTEEKLFQFQCPDWPSKKIEQFFWTTDPVNPQLISCIKNGQEELIKDGDIQSVATVRDAKLSFPRYTKLSADGVLLMASTQESEATPPAYMTVRDNVISALIPLAGLKRLDDIDECRGTVVAVGMNANDKPVMIVIKDGTFQTIDLPMSRIMNIKISKQGFGKIEGCPRDFRFQIDAQGQYQPRVSDQKNECAYSVNTRYVGRDKKPRIEIGYETDGVETKTTIDNALSANFIINQDQQSFR